MLVFGGIWHFFGRIWDFLQGFAKNRLKKCQIPAKTSIFVPFGAVHGFSRLVPDWFPSGSRLVPDWFPTGSEFAESGAEICRKRCQILTRNLPNWMISSDLGNVLVGLGRVGASLGVFGGWFWGGWGGGLGFEKVSGDFWWFGKMGENFWGFGGFGKIWRGLEGF